MSSSVPFTFSTKPELTSFLNESITARERNILHEDDDDADTASQRSVSLSSPPLSPQESSSSPAVNWQKSSEKAASAVATTATDLNLDSVSLTTTTAAATNATTTNPTSLAIPTTITRTTANPSAHPPTTLETAEHSSSDADDSSLSTRDTALTSGTRAGTHDSSPGTSAPPSPSVYGDAPEDGPAAPIYPPQPIQRQDERMSVASFASATSSSSRKARPESMLIGPLTGPLVLGVALVDFNHIVGPRIEYHKDAIFESEEVAKILPFLALPDGAHLSSEDYSYFHLVPSGPNPTTIFGISCNQQIAATALLVRPADVTRSTVQKAVVVLASKPAFGPIRDKLGVVTTALFHQRDFSEMSILDDFSASLEAALRSQMTESGLFMGTNLRHLVHTFRSKTLVLIKALILQKRIMFYGHPVERLCTSQYSLVSLIPGLLQTLDDCGSPPLANRAPTLSKPMTLKTSDRKSMMAFTGFPLDLFGKDAFFQPYLPLQQIDMLKDTPSWLCGSTNSIVTSQKEVDLLVDIEQGSVEFRNPDLERVAGLTPADRKWMEEIVTDVNAGWNDDDPTHPTTLGFKGSDDYIRVKFEEYISSALSTVKYQTFVTRNNGKGVPLAAGSESPWDDFNPLWLAEFKRTNAHEVWERVTDEMLFDIVEPRHPCNDKPSVVTDIGMRLTEGIQDLKLDQQLNTVSRTFSAGSAGLFSAVSGIRERWAQKPAAGNLATLDEAPVKVEKQDVPAEQQQQTEQGQGQQGQPQPQTGGRISWLTRTWSAAAATSPSTSTPASATATAETTTDPTTSASPNKDGSAMTTTSSSASSSFSFFSFAPASQNNQATATPAPPPPPPKDNDSTSIRSVSSRGSVAGSGSPNIGGGDAGSGGGGGGGWRIGSLLSKAAPRLSLSRTASRSNEPDGQQQGQQGQWSPQQSTTGLKKLSLSTSSSRSSLASIRDVELEPSPLLSVRRGSVRGDDDESVYSDAGGDNNGNGDGDGNRSRNLDLGYESERGRERREREREAQIKRRKELEADVQRGREERIRALELNLQHPNPAVASRAAHETLFTASPMLTASIHNTNTKTPTFKAFTLNAAATATAQAAPPPPPPVLPPTVQAQAPLSVSPPMMSPTTPTAATVSTRASVPSSPSATTGTTTTTTTTSANTRRGPLRQLTLRTGSTFTTSTSTTASTVPVPVPVLKVDVSTVESSRAEHQPQKAAAVPVRKDDEDEVEEVEEVGNESGEFAAIAL